MPYERCPECHAYTQRGCCICSMCHAVLTHESWVGWGLLLALVVLVLFLLTGCSSAAPDQSGTAHAATARVEMRHTDDEGLWDVYHDDVHQVTCWSLNLRTPFCLSDHQIDHADQGGHL